MTFKALQLAPALLKAVQEMGFESPTPIQQQAIPAVISGADLMAAAQTGTGKTGGFALPILHVLSEGQPARSQQRQTIPRALVLAPTRELAAQIDESFREFAQYVKIKTTVIYGGVSMNPQIQRLQRGVDIIIATPGRLLDLYQQGFVDLSRIAFLVLDEADRMLDMGFIDDIRKIIDLLPKERQNLLFSATFSKEIRGLAEGLLKNPLTIDVTPPNSTVELIQQLAHPVSRARKSELLLKLIQENQWFQVLIFTRTKSMANRLEEILIKYGIRAAALHGNKSQAARTVAMKDFKSGRVQALVATDIAARGIDIDQLPCVINYDLPNTSEDYVHRIGRTGRAGAEGIAISLVTVDEAGFMQQIEKLIGREVEHIEIEDFAPPATEVAMPIVMGRQVIWGGIGKPPSRKTTADHVKAERQHLNQERIKMRNEKQTTKQSKSRDEKSKSSGRRKSDKDFLKGFSNDSDRDSSRGAGRNSGRSSDRPSGGSFNKDFDRGFSKGAGRDSGKSTGKSTGSKSGFRSAEGKPRQAPGGRPARNQRPQQSGGRGR